ncbi:Golgi apparatus membrane tvp38 [Hyphodiscus hymeniophilus]|uniref:Golgi apparatus membrane protein TVP38 n=1 Tax=Hyphodiscus hymeniophilus TaxID=353542 RepID=A0A9P6VPB2_9HELO|nr:Golgi apparatus membrane tvp38 [Hyphodiscus hymeniophilus]
MPADYSSTARALALPISPLESPSLSSQASRPPWSRRLTSSARRTTGQITSPYSIQTPGDSLSMKDQILRSADKVSRKIVSTFQKLSLFYKILVIIAGLVSFTFGILFLVYSERIFGYLAPAAEKWRDIRGGWMILWALTFVSAFPPLIGYSTTITISGFVYGFPNGWFIVSTATVVGSLCSFLASRTILSSYVNRLVGQDKRFEALALTLKHDGLKILCMIRFCPLPYSLSNAAMSTFPTVHPLSFALATLISSPKLLIHVFIGSRMGKLAEGGMDASTKAINYASIIIGGVLGVAVGYIIYQRTIARAKELEVEELEAATGEGEERVEGYFDGVEGDANMMGDDDISLWDNEDNRESGGYRDNFTAEEDVFARGDADEEMGAPNGKGRPRK